MRQASQQLLNLTFTNKARNTQLNNAECAVNKTLKCRTAKTDYGNNVIHTHLFWKQIDIRLVSAMWSIEQLYKSKGL
jgi:hypothetical protein